MGKIQKYAEASKLLDIRIQYGEEFFKFNLFEELLITEARMDSELKTQASSFAFIAMLHKKLIRVVDDKKMEMDKTYYTKYLEGKELTQESSGRPFTDDQAKAYASSHKEYIKAIQAYNDAKEKAGVISVCVDSFEQRKDLLQTLSANLRKDH